MKKLKKALICSLFSMMFCTSIFVGTTYAWFTDEVNIPTNQIVAGNLDVDLSVKNGTNYQSVASDTKLFKEDVRWEPGHVEVVNLKVSNLGTLALKFQLSVFAGTETPAENVNGETFNLSNYIMFASIVSDQEANVLYADRDAALTAALAANPTKLGGLDYTNEGVLIPGEAGKPTSKYVALVVYMPETVDNVANYRGEVVPTIDLGVKLLATQTPYDKENDSFGSDYDSNASYSTSSQSSSIQSTSIQSSSSMN